MKSFLELLRQHRSAIETQWVKRTIATYPKDAALFFARNNNQFANPVGRTLDQELRAVLQALLAKSPAEELCLHVEEIIKLRAVHDFTPARALSFVFMLKEVIVDLLAKEFEAPETLAGYLQFEPSIDQLALYSFDIYTKYRQKMYEIRVAEVKRQVAGLMKRSQMFVDDLGE
jgi:hypothetical protein